MLLGLCLCEEARAKLMGKSELRNVEPTHSQGRRQNARSNFFRSKQRIVQWNLRLLSFWFLLGKSSFSLLLDDDDEAKLMRKFFVPSFDPWEENDFEINLITIRGRWENLAATKSSKRRKKRQSEAATAADVGHHQYVRMFFFFFSKSQRDSTACEIIVLYW
jgi:hypothetical protein